MSREETCEVQCPQCGHRQETMRWYSVNASITPQAKAALLSGQFHVFRCEKCTVKVRLDVEVIYNDAETRFCVMYYPPALLNDNNFFELFTADAGLKLRALPDIPEAEYIRRPHIVFDMDEMRRYILFRDRLAQRRDGQRPPQNGAGIETP